MEQLIQVTNSTDFLNDWAFFVTGLTRITGSNRLIISLEASYDQFDASLFGRTKNWQVACDGFFDHRLPVGYLRPFYQLRVLTNHPLLWKYGAETFFSVVGSCNDIPSLMGDLFLAHTEICGNWIEFHKVFGFLPVILETKRQNQLSAPTPLWQYYAKILERHNVVYTVNTHQENRQLSALLFGNPNYPDRYNYGQPFVTAESFSLI